MSNSEDNARELRSKKLSIKYLKEEIAYMENKLEEYEADVKGLESLKIIEERFIEYPDPHEYAKAIQTEFKKYI